MGTKSELERNIYSVISKYDLSKAKNNSELAVMSASSMILMQTIIGGINFDPEECCSLLDEISEPKEFWLIVDPLAMGYLYGLCAYTCAKFAIEDDDQKIKSLREILSNVFGKDQKRLFLRIGIL